ncbi:MAG: RNA polymerase sigma factor [Planctomycetes bacterium]|nr:RNA polymerase sigma factor [Planctomycetota bacterium]
MTTITKNETVNQSPSRTESADIDVREFEGFSDSRLVELSRNENHEAFGELVGRYEGRLKRVISRFILDQDLVDDLTQEVFLRVYRRLELFDASRRFGPWLFQIGVNLTLDHLRKTQRRIRWTLFSQRNSDEPRTIDPETDDPRQQLDLAQEVRAVLDHLPEKYRTVLVLRDLENFSTAEIAAILNRKEATIRWRLAEARSKFQKLWVAKQNRDTVRNGSEAATNELSNGEEADRSVGR